MRKIQNIAFVLLATLFAGCINDHIENTLCRDGVLSLNLSTGSSATRTGTDNNGVGDGTNDDGGSTDAPEESTIFDVQFFLYPKGSSESVNATFAGVIEVTPNAKPNHDTTEQTVTVPADAINKLCPNPGDECDIYVIVNYIHQGGEDLTDNADTSRATLKSLPLETVFYDLGIPPASFVMDSEVFGVTRGTDDNSNKLTSETIYVTRAAAKVMIEVTVQSTVDVSGVQWQPVTEVESANEYFARISFYNGVKEGVIDDNSDTEPTGKDIADSASADPYYHAENIELIPGGISSDITNPGTSSLTRASSKAFITDAPLYSYTSSWSDGDEDAPYFKLSIPWRKVVEGQDDNAAWVTYDYTVPISLKTNQLVRNKLYLIRLNVGALGDLDYLDPAVYSYVVLDWEDVSMNAELSRPQYLVVDKNYVEMNNIEEVRVGYQSSDAVSATIISVSRDNVKGRIVEEDIRDNAESTNTENGWNDFNNQDFSISTEGGVVTLTHKLDNDRNSDYFDYVPYEIIVEVVNESGFVERITFVQYPAMYVEADANTDYQQNTNHDETWEDSWNDNHGYQWVNGYRGSSYNNSGSGNNAYHYVTVNDTRVQYLASSNGLSDNAGNKNPNMYTITVSSFSDGSYLVGDPRTTHYDETLKDAKLGNSDYYVFASAPALSGTSPRRLQYYYPTDDSDNTINVISPKFRVASSYSVLGSTYLTSREVARRRCASYQEDGYPAGRWRMATAAEMQFMIQLSQQELIPALFSSNTNYWCAHGVINYVTGATTATLDKVTSHDDGGSIRCVYDEWYWGSDKAIESNANAQFTWGDELRPGDSAN